jgi:hypothetical protein
MVYAAPTAWVALVAAGAGGCLEAREGGREEATWAATKASLQSAMCAYEVRCGVRGASEEESCRAAASFGAVWLDGRPLWLEGQAYSTGEALDAGRLALDAGRVAVCLAALTEGPCHGVDTVACRAILAPRVPARQACRDRRECQTDLCAVVHDATLGPLPGPSGCEGACVERIALGAACGLGSLACEEDGYCDSEKRVCTPLAGRGDACTLGACTAGLVCGEDGRCEPLRALGEPCSRAVFPNGGCELALTCVEGTCRQPGGEGEACENSLGGGYAGIGGLGALVAGACLPGLYCDAREGVGTCRPTVPDGSVCDDVVRCSGGHPCIGMTISLPDFRATPGVCGPWGDVGAPCTPPGDAQMSVVTACPQTTRCDAATATCRPRDVPALSLGDACDPDLAERCAEGTCDPATRRCALVCR